MSQSLSKILVHLVFTTKHRSPDIHDDVRHRLHEYMAGILSNHKCHAIKINSVADHVHVLFVLSKNIALAKIIERVKSGSSKWIKSCGAEYKLFAWQAEDGSWSIGERQREAVIKYIEGQQEHHRVKTFQEEYREMLTAYQIAFDEKYLWD